MAMKMRRKTFKKNVLEYCKLHRYDTSRNVGHDFTKDSKKMVDEYTTVDNHLSCLVDPWSTGPLANWTSNQLDFWPTGHWTPGLLESWPTGPLAKQISRCC
ncbi:uncharacterized protein [Panulirus ornatus]|uniref:uncharacterized protein n=1 Tax=Panulirus ornatus TaxID=150431 RepID=UPI003A899D58